MAAMLPAIHSPTSKGGQSIQQHRINSPQPKGEYTMPQIFGVTQQKRSLGKKERDIENRRTTLRAQQPYLNKLQTSQYRYDYKHNLCVDMLRDGYHESFCEVFALIKRQNEERAAAGPESSIWNQVQLENQPEKLEKLKYYLGQAEICARKGDSVQVYKAQFSLAKYFQGTGDKWLADHFYSSSLATAASVDNDGGRTAAEGHCNVALALEESGQVFDAVDNFEKFYSLSKDKPDFDMDDGRQMHPLACIHLCRIYTTIAKQYESTGNLTQYLSYLQKAYDHAKEGGDREVQGEAGYRLGQAYEKNGDSQTALTYLTSYLDACQSIGNSDGIGKACEAIAKSYESEGKVEESIKYLEMFVEVAERSKNDKAISWACSDLGAMFNSLGRYEQAVEYFNKSYNIARAMNDTESISSSRVLFGVAAAHKMLQAVTLHVDTASRPCLERLVEWKDNRGDEFDKPLPESGTIGATTPSTPATKTATPREMDEQEENPEGTNNEENNEQNDEEKAEASEN